jgi:hypothetical protein
MQTLVKHWQDVRGSAVQKQSLAQLNVEARQNEKNAVAPSAILFLPQADFAATDGLDKARIPKAKGASAVLGYHQRPGLDLREPEEHVKDMTSARRRCCG